MENKKYKGVVITSYLREIKRKWGIDSGNKAMEFASLKSLPKSGEWIDAEKVDKIVEWVVVNYGEQKLREISGRTISNMGIFTYFFTANMGIETMLKKARAQFKAVSSFGDMIIEIEGRKANIRIKDIKISKYSCLAWEGILEGMLKIKRRMGKVEIIDSNNDCIFTMVWD